MIGALRTALSGLSCRRVGTPPSVESLLRPFLVRAQQCRAASILGSLSDNGAYNKRIRRGRGPSAGKGKTSGRGHKGQNQHGKTPAGFTGGQTPEHIVHGLRGFKNNFSVDMSPINLDRIQQWIDAGRLNPRHPITVNELCSSRCLHGVKDGIKLLARGAVGLTTPIHIVVSRASEAAIQAVEKAGGSVTTRYYTKSSIRRIRRHDTHPYHSLRSKPMAFETADEASNVTIPGKLQRSFKYRLPDPIGRKDLEYYRDPAHRGYLSYTIQEGQSPSLFFRSPSEVRPKKTAAAGGNMTSAAKSNTMW